MDTINFVDAQKISTRKVLVEKFIKATVKTEALKDDEHLTNAPTRNNHKVNDKTLD